MASHGRAYRCHRCVASEVRTPAPPPAASTSASAAGACTRMVTVMVSRRGLVRLSLAIVGDGAVGSSGVDANSGRISGGSTGSDGSEG